MRMKRRISKSKNPLEAAGFGVFGGDGRDRTADLLIANQSLSQLSYAPV